MDSAAGFQIIQMQIVEHIIVLKPLTMID